LKDIFQILSYINPKSRKNNHKKKTQKQNHFFLKQVQMASAFKKFLPTLNRVLVKKFEQEARTASGIILQEAADKNVIGEVIEIGPGNLNEQGARIPVYVKKGDMVLLPDYGGSKVKIQGVEYFIYRDSDILGILHK